jgi:hypothetical protein
MDIGCVCRGGGLEESLSHVRDEYARISSLHGA